MLARNLLFSLTLISSTTVAAQPAGAPSPGPASPTIDRTTQTEDVKFQSDADKRMTVPVRLSGTGPYRFLVDTGADRTAVSRELAARLHLVSAGPAELHSATGESEVSTAMVPEIELTRDPIRAIDAAVLESENMGADGILGSDSLESKRVLFDFEGQTMAVVPSTTADFENEPGTIVITAKRRYGRLIVTDAKAAGHGLTVVIDTGSELCIGNAALRRELAGSDLIGTLKKIDLISVTGDTISGDYMLVPRLEIGGIELRNLAVVFADAHTFKQLKLDRRPALLLGMNAIRAFKKVSIDFANRRFRAVLPQSSALTVQFAAARLR